MMSFWITASLILVGGIALLILFDVFQNRKVRTLINAAYGLFTTFLVLKFLAELLIEQYNSAF